MRLTVLSFGKASLYSSNNAWNVNYNGNVNNNNQNNNNGVVPVAALYTNINSHVL